MIAIIIYDTYRRRHDISIGWSLEKAKRENIYEEGLRNDTQGRYIIKQIRLEDV